MKMIHENLCNLISDLDIICETLSSLRKGAEIGKSPLIVDDYFRFLLASEKIREAIEILGGIGKKTENITSVTKNGIYEEKVVERRAIFSSINSPAPS